MNLNDLIQQLQDLERNNTCLELVSANILFSDPSVKRPDKKTQLYTFKI